MNILKTTELHIFKQDIWLCLFHLDFLKAAMRLKNDTWEASIVAHSSF